MNFRLPRRQINSFWAFASLVIALLPIMAVLAYYVAPSDLIVFQWLGIGLPFLLGLNLLIGILFIFFGCLNRVFLFLLIVSWVIYIPLMYQINLPSKVSEKDLSICSYNVRGMQADYGFSTLQHIADFANSRDFDILCLQEVPLEYDSSKLLEEFDHMQYIALNDSIPYGDSRLIVMSKYPLKVKESKSNHGREFALLADVHFKENVITVVNCHLQTTNWNQIKGVSSIFSLNSFRKLVGNWLERERQVLSIQQSINVTSTPLIVVGDFNAPPVSYSYHMLKSNRMDAFREAGNGYGNTYRYLNGLYRIDYIFYDRNYFKAIDYQTLELEYSDHFPIVADLVLSTQ